MRYKLADLRSSGCLTASLCMLIVFSTSTIGEQDSLESAKKLFMQGEYEQSLAILSELLEQDPDNADAHAWMGNVLGMLSETTSDMMMKMQYGVRAIQESEMAVKLDPNNITGLMGRGGAMLAAPPPYANLDAAMSDFQKVLELDPDHVDAHFGLGLVYQRKGESNKAKAQFEKALRLEPGHAGAKAELGKLTAFYRTGVFIVILSITGGASLFGVIILGVQRWRLSRAEKLRLQHELEDARRMQLRLLPESPPTVEGFDIAGFSRPAREVGGDFFDYPSLANGKIGIVLADVSGKGLKAAMNAVLADGMLREVATIEASCGKVLSRLNADLYPLVEKQMFTALGLAIIDQDTGMLNWANAAQPYPIVKRGEQVFEFQSDGEVPLGMIPCAVYSDWELELQVGDTVVFYTDGIIEAGNRVGEIYGVQRLEQFLADMNPMMTAKKAIEGILKNVSSFVGNAEQYDDMTIVILKKL